jgi:multidrug resistance protein, MATE family
VITAEPVVTRPTLRQLVTLAWPIVVSRSSQVVVGTADALMVAPLGEAALGATTTAGLNSFAFFALQIGTVFIVGSFASQLSGRGDDAGARRFALYGLVVAALSTLLAAVAIPFLGTLLSPLSLGADVQPLVVDYMRYRLLSAGAAVGLEALGAYYGGTKNTVLPMIAQVLAMALNVALNWVLIYGKLGAPAMGVAGAGLASTLATTLAFGFLLACFAWRFGAPEVKAGRMRLAELWRTLRFGVPVGLNWFVELMAFIVFVDVVVAGLGTTELAATMAVMQINSVSFMPAFAMSSAGAIFVGQAIGANKRDDVPRTLRLTITATMAWQGMLALLYLAVPRLWLAPFVPDGATSFLAIGAGVLALSAAWQLFDGLAMAVAEALRAAGDTAFSLWARAALGWLVFVPGALLTTRVWGGRELAAASWLVVYLALLAGVLLWRFAGGKWRTLELVEEPLVE